MSLGAGMRSPTHTRQRGLLLYITKVVGAGAAVPTFPDGEQGDAVSVARSAAGIYVFTFPGDTGVSLDIRGVRCSLKQGTAKDLFCTTDYSEADKTVTVTVKDGASAFADIDLTTSEVLMLEVLVSTSKTLT